MAAPPQYQTDAAAAALGNLLKLQPHGATPPVNAYVTADHVLGLRARTDLSNITLQLFVLMLLPDGSINRTLQLFPLTSTRAQNFTTFPLPEGYILEVQVFVAGGTNPASRIYVQLLLQIGQGPSTGLAQVLCQGYISFMGSLTWPDGLLTPVDGGAGGILSVTGTTPGAGAEISETVPTNAIWRIKAFQFQLTTSATVANRIPIILVDDGSNVFFKSPSLSSLTASATWGINFGDATNAFAASNGQAMLTFPDGVRLGPGFRIRTTTSGLQAGDQYSSPLYLVEEWLVP